MSTDPRWEHAKRVLEAAFELDPTARVSYVSDACGSDEILLSEVRSLLHWHDDEFLAEPAARVAEVSALAASAAGMIGRSLGAWRIVEIIGHGGMGVVYRAERADRAFQRRVAIKVVRPGGDPAQVLQRFRAERETLAALDHPNIARLFDGGTTDQGEPYFVMELVEGTPIDRYCDDRRMTIAARLALFREVCAAVQYAHQSLVVHRDIKPDNLLVTSEGTPKLLDFGVAKILSTDPAPEFDRAPTAATWLMTPDYASPEQLEGRPSGTASDVYSLGALLHLLLTGERPYHLGGATPAAIREQLCNAVLPPLHVRVRQGDSADERAASRSTTPARLAAQLSGDLDAIVRHALGRTPDERYATVEQLLADLERHRTSHPVSTRRHQRGYVALAFMARHRLALSVASAIVLLMIVGVAAVLWQASATAEARRRAERRFNDVRQLAGPFMFEVHDAIVELPGATPARELIVKTTIKYLESLAREAQGDAGLQRELARGFLRVGDVQGNPTNPNLGDTGGALASYRRAIGIAEALRREAPGDLEAVRVLALAHRRLGDVLSQSGDLPAAVRESEASQQLYTTIAAGRAPSLDDRLEVAIASIKVGDVLGNPNFSNVGRSADAERNYQAALAALRPLDAQFDSGSDVRVRRFLGITLERIGTMHERAARWADATAAYQESYQIRKALADRQPLHSNIQRDLAIAHEKLGNVQQATGNGEAAAQEYRFALTQFERLARADPTNVNAARTVAISQEKLATLLVQMGRPHDAVPLFRAALATQQDFAKRDPGNTGARCDVARLGQTLAAAVAGRQRGAIAAAGCTP